jgi:hypothetical protein
MGALKPEITMRHALTIALSAVAVMPTNLRAETERAARQWLGTTSFYVCDHGIDEGAFLVGFRWSGRNADGGRALEGVGGWSGADIVEIDDVISLRRQHDFVALYEATDNSADRPARGVVNGVAFTGTCFAVSDDVQALTSQMLSVEN